ncbi:MAG: hypothetical protein KDC80_14275, partial [Saprospiraceae bacterium]|nr:hypothetical protein [Saprospiraceae bacterium]
MMLNSRKITAFLMFLSMGFHACKQLEKDSPQPTYPDLNIYLTRFEEEARSRSYDVDLSEVLAVYSDQIIVEGKSYCGYGYSNYSGTGTRRIVISKSASCRWLDRSDIERENLFFHE